MDSFNRYDVHIHGNVHLSYTKSINRILTLGQDDVILNWDASNLNKRKQLQLPNELNQQYTCVGLSPQENELVVGTKSGKVFLISLDQIQRQQIIYRGEGSIRGVKYSNSGKFIEIASEQLYGIIFSREDKKIIKCKKGHENNIKNTLLTSDDSLFITVGEDGYANIYEFNSYALQYLAKYRIGSTRIPISQRPIPEHHIAFGGSTTLQQLKAIDGQLEYKLKISIHQSSQIQQLCWIHENCLVTGTQEGISIWQYHHGRKLKTIQQERLMNAFSNGITFFLTNHQGALLEYKETEQLQKLKQIVQEQQSQHSEPKQQEEVEPEKPKKPELSKAAYIITVYPQTALQSRYEGYLQNRFLFYNDVGCVVEREGVRDSMIELQFHDKSRIRRTKFQSSDKYICYFALSKDCFVYSRLSHFFVEYQGYNRVKANNYSQNSSKDYFLQKWEYKWTQIQGISIGNSWISVANSQEVKFFDFLGNQLYTLCLGRKFMAMSAYEDLFAVMYHVGIPMGGAQMFEMKIYTISQKQYKFIRKAIVPVRTGELINWFGFSLEGMIFLQDTNESIRFYSWNANQWIPIYAGNKNKERVYIQHIQNYQLYGFKVQQKEGLPMGPTVLPRSLPRKLNLQLPQPNLPFLTPDENKRLKKVIMKKHIYEHQKFRYQRWYKLKYSRRRDHPLFQQTINIPSREDLNLTLSTIDIQIVEYVKKLWPSLQNNQEYGSVEIKNNLIRLCANFIGSRETLNKLKLILGIHENYSELYDGEYELDNSITTLKKPLNYNGMRRLVQMIDL